MRIELLNFDASHYAANLQQAGETLKWDTKGATHHLIIRAEFGANIVFDDQYKAAIEKFENSQIFSQNEVRFGEQGRYFALLPKGHVTNYHFPVRPAAYGVFCCQYDQETDTCKLYLPNEACLYQINVAAAVEISITRAPAKKGLSILGFGRKEDEKIYYMVNIPAIPNYSDGQLYYTYDGCSYQFPVTKGMLNKQICIPAYGEKPPKVMCFESTGYTIK